MKLTVNNLSVATPRENLVNNVSLSVETGETLALVGASGSGKSLTCSSIFDLLPTGLTMTGDILVDDEPVEASKLRGRIVSCIMQNPSSSFNPLQTMRKHGQETMNASNGSYDENTLIAAMHDAGLDNARNLLEYYPFQMSGGMLQRMMIALALVSNAPFLVADEPTTDLDLVVQSRILERVQSIAKERNLGVLLVTHDFGVVAKLANRVSVMSKGQIVEQGTVEQIFTAPTHKSTMDLLNAHLSLYKDSAHV